jgi:protein O-GlcNAc transferase
MSPVRNLACGLARPYSGVLSHFSNIFRNMTKCLRALPARSATPFRRPAITASVKERLERTFAAAGLRADYHCVFLNRLSQSKFVAAAGLSDVFLDSIGWSGCNSALECLTQALPIVTFEGATMRGRHSAAILRMIGVEDTIATTVDDYVAIATRLGKDAQFRRAISSRMAENRHKIYRDRAPVAALEDFLEKAVRG